MSLNQRPRCSEALKSTQSWKLMQQSGSMWRINLQMPLFFYPDSNHILYPYKYILLGLDLDKQEGLISQCDGVRNYRILYLFE